MQGEQAARARALRVLCIAGLAACWELLVCVAALCVAAQGNIVQARREAVTANFPKFVKAARVHDCLLTLFCVCSTV
jgi:hypothetical protein